MVRREDRFEPNPENVELYAQLCAVSAEITAQTDAILERTHRILLAHKGVVSYA